MHPRALHPTVLAVAASLFSAHLVAQQTKVLPIGMDFVEGPTVFINPFNQANPTCGIQVLIDASNFHPGPAVLTGLRFRPTQQTQTSISFTKPYQVNLYVVPTTATAFEATLSPYDPNAVIAGATPTQVFNGPLTLPATTPLTVTPAPFAIYIPFAAPFLYDPAAGNLLVMLESTDLTPVPTTCRIDAVQFRETDITGVVAPIDGQGCVVAGASLQASTAATSVVIGSTIQTTLTATPPLAFVAAYAVLAFARADTDLAVIGMPGCTGRIQGTFLDQILIAGPGGLPPVTWPVPADPNLIGVAAVAQTIGLAASGLLQDSVISNAEALRVADSALRVPSMMAGFHTVSGSVNAWFHGTLGEFTPIVQLEGIFP